MKSLTHSSRWSADSARPNVAFGDHGAFLKLLCTGFEFYRGRALGNPVHHGLEETTDLCQLDHAKHWFLLNCYSGGTRNATILASINRDDNSQIYLLN